MNQINILGIDLNNYSLKEALALTESFLQEGLVKTVLYIDAKMIVTAGENENYRDYLSKCDLTIIDDEGIVEALPQTQDLKIEDVEEETYTRILLKKLVYGHKRITLLSDTTENLSGLEDNLLSYRNDLTIVSKIAMDSVEDSVETMVNEINDVIPDVIISRMEAVRQAEIMEKSRKMMNCRLWVGLPERAVLLKGKTPFYRKLWNKLFSKAFRKEVEKYGTKETS